MEAISTRRQKMKCENEKTNPRQGFVYIKRKNTLEHWIWLFLIVVVTILVILAVTIMDKGYTLVFFETLGGRNTSSFVRVFLFLTHIAVLLFVIFHLNDTFMENKHIVKYGGNLYPWVNMSKPLGEADLGKIVEYGGVLYSRENISKPLDERNPGNLDKEEINSLKQVFAVTIIHALLLTSFPIFFYIGGEFLLNVLIAAINAMPFIISVSLFAFVLLYISSIHYRRYRRSKEFNVPARMIYVDYTESLNITVIFSLSILSGIFKALCLLSVFLYVILTNPNDSSQHITVLEDMVLISFAAAFILHCIVLYYVKPKDKNYPGSIKKLFAKIKDLTFVVIWGSILLIASIVAKALYTTSSHIFLFACGVIVVAIGFYFKMVSDYLKFGRQKDLLSLGETWYSDITTIQKDINGEDISFIVAFRHDKNMWICFAVTETQHPLSSLGDGRNKEEYEYTVYTINTKNFYIFSLDGLGVYNEKGGVVIM